MCATGARVRCLSEHVSAYCEVFSSFFRWKSVKHYRRIWLAGLAGSGLSQEAPGIIASTFPCLSFCVFPVEKCCHQACFFAAFVTEMCHHPSWSSAKRCASQLNIVMAWPGVIEEEARCTFAPHINPASEQLLEDSLQVPANFYERQRFFYEMRQERMRRLQADSVSLTAVFIPL